MPKPYARSKFGRKRYGRRRPYNHRFAKKRRIARKVPANQRMSTIPNRLFTKMKYCETIQLDPAASGIPSLQLYNLNSVFDPSQTNTGGTTSISNHQVSYLDTFDDIYNKYRVHGCKWKIRAYNMEHQKPMRILVRTFPHTMTPTTSDDIDAMRQQPGSQYAVLTGRESSHGGMVFKGFTSIRRLEGVKNLTTVAYEAVMTSSPQFVPTLGIYTQSIESSFTYSASVYVDIELTYYTELFDRNIKLVTD